MARTQTTDLGTAFSHHTAAVNGVRLHCVIRPMTRRWSCSMGGHRLGGSGADSGPRSPSNLPSWQSICVVSVIRKSRPPKWLLCRPSRILRSSRPQFCMLGRARPRRLVATALARGFGVLRLPVALRSRPSAPTFTINTERRICLENDRNFTHEQPLAPGVTS